MYVIPHKQTKYVYIPPIEEEEEVTKWISVVQLVVTRVLYKGHRAELIYYPGPQIWRVIDQDFESANFFLSMLWLQRMHKETN